MKKFYTLAMILACLTLFTNCNNDDDEAEQVACDEWFEGTPCEAMTTKFLGNYEGGAGFCGVSYLYEITKTPDVVNGIDINIQFIFMGEPSGPIVTINALLTGSTEFDIPEQGSENASGFGSLDGDMLTFFLESPDVGYSCTHEATKIN